MRDRRPHLPVYNTGPRNRSRSCRTPTLITAALRQQHANERLRLAGQERWRLNVVMTIEARDALTD